MPNEERNGKVEELQRSVVEDEMIYLIDFKDDLSIDSADMEQR